MAYGSIPIEKRLKDNIRNYKASTLFNLEGIIDLAKSMHKLTGVEVLVTDRHGDKTAVVGEWAGFNPDVTEDPGIKVRVADRTIAHVYIKYDKVESDKVQHVKKVVAELISTYERMGEKTYRCNELEMYAEEINGNLEADTKQAIKGERTDELTGTLTRTYFEKKMNVIDRSQVAPIAAICININDWKYVNDKYGDDESDRLISVIADIITKKATPEYVIGRVDGDVFNVVIPMPQDGEAEAFIEGVREECLNYTDDRIAPSVAIGMAIKDNVETDITVALSDAEYAMFEDKIEVKNAPGYRARLTHGEEA